MAAKPKIKKKTLPAPITPHIEVPKQPMHVAFCEAWLKHFDHKRAALDAGYSKSWVAKNNPRELMERFASYLQKRREQKEAAIAKELALEQKDILSAMYAVASSNVQDYVKEVDELEEVVDQDGTKKQVVVRRLRPKGVLELTREQAAALSSVVFHPNGTVSYALPDDRTKHMYWKDLGQHLGLFHPKLIAEHRHEHRHRMVSFRDMDAEKLAQAEAMFLEAMGQEGKRMLGIIEGEYEDISAET